MITENLPVFSSLNQLLEIRAQSGSNRWIFLKNRNSDPYEFTYSQLDERARVVGAALKAAGCKPGDRVVLLFQTGSGFLEAFFGCLYVGAVAVPLNPPRPNRKKSRFDGVMADCGSTLILTDTVTAQTLTQKLAPHISYLVVEALTAELGSLEEVYPAKDEDLAFLQYTSGSTGTPKGVMVSHANILANLETIREAGVGDDDVFVNWLPFFHDMGLIFTLLEPLYADKLSVHLSPARFMQRPITWLRAIEKYRGTICGGPNFAFEQCVRQVTPEILESLDLSHWRVAFTGAEPIRAATLNRFAEVFAPTGFRFDKFYPCYGMAEATLMVSGSDANQPPTVLNLDQDVLAAKKVLLLDAVEAGVEVVDCGAPRPGFDLVIADPATGARLEPDQIGEVWLAGPSVAVGYWNRPEATRETFGNRLADGSSGGYLATGDLGFMHEGRLYVTGRLKDLIIVRGRNYFPTDLEATAANAHEALRLDGTAAFAYDDEGETRLVIVQEVERGRKRGLNPAEIGEAVRLAIAERHGLQLDSLILLKTGALPKTSSGKVQRAACREDFLKNRFSFLCRWPDPQIKASPKSTPKPEQGQLQNLITQMVATRLGLAAAGLDPHQPLALYGMDSKTALGILGDLENLLDRELSPTIIYQYPTISDLAKFLAGVEPPDQIRTAMDRQEPMAITGMACRMPGAGDLESFWELLEDGRDAISEVPNSRWNVDTHYHSQAGTPDKMVTRWGGFLDDVDQFDAQLFNVSDLEAENMDPAQRLLLESAWQAMDDSGFGVEHFRGTNTGVFVGLAGSDYSFFQMVREGGRNAYAGTGCAPSIASNRISWQFDLRGPSMTLDTACSSSLVAIDRACKSLESRECDTALVGAVNLILTPQLTTALSQAGMMSPKGRCHAFDDKADGYVRSEGCGLVILKPLGVALRDGSHIHGVIRGSAVNQDGRGNGLTAPNGRAQKEVIQQALDRAGIKGRDISYLEAHGTGTALGDPIEMDALKTTLTPGRKPGDTCWVGSVKTNIGHTETVAGLAGLFKVLLALRKQRIPSHLHFKQLNSHISLKNIPLKIATQSTRWPRTGTPRHAGISSFGIGGTNAHIIVEEAPVGSQPDIEQTSTQIIRLSAASLQSLQLAEEALKKRLAADPSLDLAAVAETLRLGRRGFNCRSAWVAKSVNTACDPGVVYRNQVTPGKTRAAFMFTGQGSQYPGMGSGLYGQNPTYTKALDECLTVLSGVGVDLAPFLTGNSGSRTDQSELTQTRLAQPAIFSVSYALARYWQSQGITPEAVIGHSVGEFVAATLAGVFSLQAALKLVAVRGKLMQGMTPGSMLAVSSSEADLLPHLSRELSLAAVNGPKRCVAAGPPEAVDALSVKLDGFGIANQKLVTSHAFHSQSAEPILDTFRQAVIEAGPNRPDLDIISNLTGTWMTPEQACDPDYWAQHLRQTVRFEAGLRTLAQRADVYLELGPGHTLTRLGTAIFGPAANGSLISSLGGPKDCNGDEHALQTAMARLWVCGVESLRDDAPVKRVSLPPLEMTRRAFWVDQGPTPQLAAGRAENMADWFYLPRWEECPALPHKPLASGNSLVFHDGSETADRVVHALRSNGDRVYCVFAGESFGDDGDQLWVNPRHVADYQLLAAHLVDAGVKRVYHFWLFPQETVGSDRLVSSERCLERGFFSLIFLLQAFQKENMISNLKLLVITREVHAVESRDRLCAQKATILGAVAVIPHEYPQISFSHLDVGSDDQAVVGSIIHEQGAVNETPSCALRGNRRWQRGFAKMPLEQPAQSQMLRQGGVYLITGGLGGVGCAIGKYLAQHFQAKLVLMSRSAMPDRDQWNQCLAHDDPKETLAAKIRSVQAMEGCGAEILLVQGDVADVKALELASGLAKQTFGPIEGIVHAAGIPGNGVIRTKSETAARAVLTAKVAGTLALEDVFGNQNLDFMLLCSSIFALEGEFGQVDYCAANAFLDAFAEEMDQPGSRRISVSWGAWREAGMAAQMNLAPALQELHKQQLSMGLGDLEGGAAFYRALHAAHARVAVCPQDLESVLAAHQNIDFSAEAYSESAAELRPRELDQAFVPPENDLEKTLAGIWSAVIGVDSVGRHDSFFELGGDSLIASAMFARMEKELNISIPLAAFYEQPTLAGLAGVIDVSAVDKPLVPQISPVSREQELPLSFAQHRLWFAAMNQANATQFNLPGRITLRGPLDRDRLQASLQRLVDRHESMRTRFLEKDGKPFQVIEKAPRVVMAYHDLSGLTADQKDGDLARMAALEADHVFDLRALPLFRMKLVCLQHDHHVLLINLHHIIFDGWSEAVLVRDWLNFYRDPECDLAPLDIQYADFSYWQRQTLAADPDLEDWWREKMAQAPGLLLPVDHRGDRPAGSCDLVFDKDLVQQTRSFAVTQNTTVFSLCMSAWLLTLHQHSGQRDLVLGTDFANRQTPELQSLIGFFVNPLPLRISVDCQATFGGFAAALRKTLVETDERQAIPFNRLVELTRHEQDAYLPLIQSIFVQQNTDFQDVSAGDLTWSLHREPPPCKFETAVFVTENDGGIKLTYTWSANLFQSQTMKSLVDAMSENLKTLVQEPDRKLSTLHVAKAELTRKALPAGLRPRKAGV